MARLISAEEATFHRLGGYAATLSALNALKPIQGFIWREYSPASARICGIERRYFIEENAGRIDAVRAQIRMWKDMGSISEIEERLLIADLISATNRVANIAGTYGCFLSQWTDQALVPIRLMPRNLGRNRTQVAVTAQDAATIQVRPPDLVYLDPPYTKRQYASYYHILETIALGDEPVVEGVSGLRPWRDKASDYCYRARALSALSKLVRGLNAKRILLSYSEEGQVAIDELYQQLKAIGSIEAHTLMNVGRYRPNKAAVAARSSVREYLIIIEKRLQPCEAAIV
jgi:adenine-specific DNA-methyltransferase